MLKDAEQIIKKGGVIGIHAHIWQIYHGEPIGSALGPGALEGLRKLLLHLGRRHPGEVWHTTFNEVAARILSRESLGYESAR
jgi:hypothetical protein